VKIRLACPVCEGNGAVIVPASERWNCPRCDHVVAFHEATLTTTPEQTTLHQCVVCGSKDLYKKKAFPHWLGMSLLAVACIAFLVLNYYRLQWWGWGILIGSAVVDGLLYLMVRDVVVCYQCEAQHGGLGRSGNAPFELTIQERYRQMRLRQEALGSNTPPSS